MLWNSDSSICVNETLTFTIMDLLLIGQPFNAEQTVQGVSPFLPDKLNFLYDAFTASSIVLHTYVDCHSFSLLSLFMEIARSQILDLNQPAACVLCSSVYAVIP